MFFPIPPLRQPESSSPPEPPPRPLGLWLAIGANALVLGAGAVLLFAEAGNVWINPLAALMLLSLPVCFGLLAGVVSVFEVIWSGRRRAGLAGVLLSLTPWPLSLAVGQYLNLIWDWS